MNVIRIEEQLGGNLTWMLPDHLSADIDNLNPVDKKVILEKLTILTNKFVHFMVGSLTAGPYGIQAQNLFEQTLNQISGQMISALEELKRRGGQ